MNKKERIEMARLGGETAHKMGRAHKWDSESARKAGRKGGRVKRKK